jgi:hypothetical protein
MFNFKFMFVLVIMVMLMVMFVYIFRFVVMFMFTSTYYVAYKQSHTHSQPRKHKRLHTNARGRRQLSGSEVWILFGNTFPARDLIKRFGAKYRTEPFKHWEMPGDHDINPLVLELRREKFKPIILDQL